MLPEGDPLVMDEPVSSLWERLSWCQNRLRAGDSCSGSEGRRLGVAFPPASLYAKV